MDCIKYNLNIIGDLSLYIIYRFKEVLYYRILNLFKIQHGIINIIYRLTVNVTSILRILVLFYNIIEIMNSSGKNI